MMHQVSNWRDRRWAARWRVRPAHVSRAILLAAIFLAVGGCGIDQPPVTNTTPPRYQGVDEYLQGTIGSLTRPRGFRPQWVGGYSIVSHLEGTGSADVPSFMRTWLERKMRSGGMGSANLGTLAYSPRRFLQLDSTAVVAVEGLIPPGAVKGTRFDVIVRAVPGTQTTSLHGGKLWLTDLSSNGLNRRMQFSRTLARSGGWMVVNPFTDDLRQDLRIEQQREAVVLSGGVVTRDQPIDLVLNQPNYSYAADIADRINERYPRGIEDRDETAVAKSDVLVRLNIPQRFATDPSRLLQLIQHTYLYTAAGFEPRQARRLAGALVMDPSRAPDVAFAWEALGKTALPEIRIYYDHTDPDVRMAALKAGAMLDDYAVIDPLVELAADRDYRTRQRAAVLLSRFVASPQAETALRNLVDDDDRRVRITAYESLAQAGSTLIQRVPFGEGTDAKFRLDLVPSSKPLIYVTQVRIPRVVVFGPDTGFRQPLLATLWDNHLMLRDLDDSPFVTVYFQKYGSKDGETFQIAPTIANLVFLLAHRPTLKHPADGLNLTYSHVVNALYKLRRGNHLDADVEVELSPLAALISEHLRSNQGDLHPEYGEEVDLQAVGPDGEPLDTAMNPSRSVGEQPVDGPLLGNEADTPNSDLPVMPMPTGGDDEEDAARGQDNQDQPRDSDRRIVPVGPGESDPETGQVNDAGLPFPVPMPMPEDESADSSTDAQPRQDGQ